MQPFVISKRQEMAAKAVLLGIKWLTTERIPEKRQTNPQAASIAFVPEVTLSTSAAEKEVFLIFAGAFVSVSGIKRVRNPVMSDETHREKSRILPICLEPSMMLPTALTAKPMPAFTLKNMSLEACEGDMMPD